MSTLKVIEDEMDEETSLKGIGSFVAATFKEMVIVVIIICKDCYRKLMESSKTISGNMDEYIET